MTLTTFNEWRHRHSDYDAKLRGIRPGDNAAVRALMERIALQAMQLAYANGNKAFAQQVMTWAHSKRLLEA